MPDAQFETLLREIVKLQLFTVGMVAIATVVSMGVLLILGLATRRGFQESQASTERITQSTERIAQMTAQILREIRER